MVNSTSLKNNPDCKEVSEAYNNFTLGLNLANLAQGVSKAVVSKFLQASEKRAAKQALLFAAKNRDKDAQMVLDVEKELKAYGETKFGKDWWKSGLQGAGNWLDDLYNTQKNIINQWKNNIATASNIRKGNFGEIASDAFLAEKNFQPLHTRLQNIDAPTHQGIDGVFKKGNEYFIVEAKYHGTATLNPANPASGLPKQMTNEWIDQRLLDALGGNTSLRNQVAVNYRRLLAEISPDGSVIYKELDANANVIGTYIPAP